MSRVVCEQIVWVELYVSWIISVSKLCNDKLTIKCINRVIYNVDNMEEEAGESDSTKPKIKTPYKDVEKKRKKTDVRKRKKEKNQRKRE